MILTWFENNYQWLFSGLGVVLVSWFLKQKFKGSNTTNTKIQQSQKVVVNVESAKSETITRNTTKHAGDLKIKTHILFIDDEDFTVVKLLKNAGWCNTKLKRKITNIDDPSIIDAHIIFVDIVGVCGDLFRDEGLGLARALKEKFPDKKIVIYSGVSQGDRFDKTFRIVDECLPKNAEFYQFLSLVDQFANEIWVNG